MKRKLYFIAFFLLLMVFVMGCQKTSKASVHVKNSNNVAIKAYIDYARVTLQPGEEEIFELSWPGSIVMHSAVYYYPSINPNEIYSIVFEISDGEKLFYELKISQ